MTDIIGKIVSHYKIIERIGQGGMGVVYKAEDIRLNRVVALKFLPEGTVTNDAFKRFEVEARAISSLNHKNIATIYDLEVVEGRQFIVLEYLPGGTLKEKIRRQGKLEIDEIILIAQQIADGLSYAHSKNLTHRDIKPENIMFAEDGTVKITDFGLSKIKSIGEQTTSGLIVGTISYISPEQVQGASVDHRTDIWSLGIVLYEMLTGRLPFQGDLQPALIYSILTKEPTPINELREDTPEFLQNIISNCLQKNPDKRFQSAVEISVSLRHHEVKKSESRMPKFLNQYWWVASIIGVLLLIYLFFPPHQEKEEIPSVAILYLKNLGPETDESLSYGITQDLIVDLARAGLIHVAPMNDILQFKDTHMSLEEIAKRLKVSTIVEGSILRQDDIFKISAQLFDTRSKRALWTERAQLKTNEIATLQSDMAIAIMNALQISSTEQTKKEISAKPTENPEAYEYYLNAKFKFENKKNRDDVLRAEEMYKKAILLDPTLLYARIGLAEVYSFNGEYIKSRDVYLEALNIAREQNKRSIEATCLRGLGLIHWNQGEYARALEKYKQSLLIVRELGDRFNEARILNNIGLVYWNQYIYEKALEYYNESLHLREELSDIQGQAQTLGNMGLVYWNQGDYQNALNAHLKSLKLNQDIGDKKGEGHALNNIGLIYADLGNYKNALDYYYKSEKIFEQLGNPKNLAITLDNIGLVLTEREEYLKALDYHDRSLKLTHEIGDRGSEPIRFQSIGLCYLRKGDLQKAKENLIKSINQFAELNDTVGQITSTSYLGVVCARLSEKGEARILVNQIEQLLKSGVQISEPIIVNWNISQIYTFLGNYELAKKHLEKAYFEIISRSEKIMDPSLRDSYISKVKTHREIIQTWKTTFSAKQ